MASTVFRFRFRQFSDLTRRAGQARGHATVQYQVAVPRLLTGTVILLQQSRLGLTPNQQYKYGTVYIPVCTIDKSINCEFLAARSGEGTTSS